MNIHEASVLNKLTERGPGWTILALVILRMRAGSTRGYLVVGASGISALGVAGRMLGWL